jgi:hypothetical protein
VKSGRKGPTGTTDNGKEQTGRTDSGCDKKEQTGRTDCDYHRQRMLTKKNKRGMCVSVSALAAGFAGPAAPGASPAGPDAAPGHSW